MMYPPMYVAMYAMYVVMYVMYPPMYVMYPPMYVMYAVMHVHILLTSATTYALFIMATSLLHRSCSFLPSLTSLLLRSASAFRLSHAPPPPPPSGSPPDLCLLTGACFSL